MYRILAKQTLGPAIEEYIVEAPEVAKTARAGHFVVIRLHERGERVPLTIVETDPTTGGVTLVVQEVGKSTREMGERYGVGDAILDVAGPLGVPSEIEKIGTVVCVGGGLGIAPLFPIARDLKRAGNTVLGVIGARSRDLLIYERKMRDVCDDLVVMTDDGSAGRKGFVSDALREILAARRDVARVWAIGPAIMMKVCVGVTREFGVRTTVSLNSIMIDGTGMCGGCRVEVGKATKFACVDGPEFDGHEVDFDLLMSRQKFYAEEEACSLERYLAAKKEGGR